MGDPTLLDEFPLYWTPEPKFQSVRRLEDLSPKGPGDMRVFYELEGCLSHLLSID